MALLHTAVKPFVTSDFCRRKENPLLLKTALIELLEGGDYCMYCFFRSINHQSVYRTDDELKKSFVGAVDNSFGHVLDAQFLKQYFFPLFYGTLGQQ